MDTETTTPEVPEPEAPTTTEPPVAFTQEYVDRTVAQAVEAAVAEAVQRERARARVEVAVAHAASGRLVDPADAGRYLDLDALAEAGADPATVRAEVDALLRSRPYLAGPSGPGPNLGARTSANLGNPHEPTSADAVLADYGRRAARVKARRGY